MCQPTPATEAIRPNEVGFSHHETNKMAYMTLCPNCRVAVVFVNTLLHTLPRPELISRKWGCSIWES